MSKSDNVAVLPEKPPASMPMPGGREQFWNLIAFLNDKKSFENRMKSLEEATAKHNAAVKLLGGAKGIDTRLKKAAEAEKVAKELLDEAKAYEIRVGGRLKVSEAELATRGDALDKRQAELNEDQNKLATDQTALDDHALTLQKRGEQLTVAELKAGQALQDANELKGQFEARLGEHKAMLKALEQETT